MAGAVASLNRTSLAKTKVLPSAQRRLAMLARSYVESSVGGLADRVLVASDSSQGRTREGGASRAPPNAETDRASGGIWGETRGGVNVPEVRSSLWTSTREQGESQRAHSTKREAATPLRRNLACPAPS